MRASATFNDRSRVTEARAFACSLPADVRDHRFGDFSIDDQLRQFLFLRGTDFAKDHDRFRERILFEHQCRVWQANSNHRVTADVHNGRNAHACLPKIVAGTRSHAAGAADHSHSLRHARLEPWARALRATVDHPDHALAGAQCSERVRSQKRCAICLRCRRNLHRVPQWHAIRHQHREFNARFNRRDRGVLHTSRRHKENGDVNLA